MNFDPDSNVTTVSITIVNDSIYEGNETFTLHLRIVNNCVITLTESMIMITIEDNDGNFITYNICFHV